MLRFHSPPSIGFLLGIPLYSLLMLFTLQPPVHAQSGTLPELGEAATRYLDPNDEEMIGRRFLRELTALDRYIADHELRHYLNTLGRQIGSKANLGGLSLKLNLIRENELNAFAVPGGYITFNSGLLLTVENESELASVVGHEIAHLSQRHLPRMVAQIQANQIPTTAAILASILVGGQAGVAGATLASASMLSNRLAYSREFEREADAIGIDLMAQSGYDPRAMATFFSRLQRFSHVSAKDVPEYLRTHPLSYTRVAESEARIGSYPPVRHESSLDFHLARARVQALYGDPQADTLQILEARIDQSRGIQRQAWRYGLALALMEARKYDRAAELANDVNEHLPDTPQVRAAGVEIIRQSGNPEAAALAYGELVESYPGAGYLRYAYLETLLEAGNAEEAKRFARFQLRRHPDDYEFYPLLSRANVALGSLAEAHQADAEHHAALGRIGAALSSLKLALRDNDDQSQYLTQAIKARIEKLEREAADWKLLERHLQHQ